MNRLADRDHVRPRAVEFHTGFRPRRLRLQPTGATLTKVWDTGQ